MAGIIDDIRAGESPMSLNKARQDPRLSIDGRSRAASWIYRAADKGVKDASGTLAILESIVQSGRKVTTPSAIGRFVERQANPKKESTQEPSKA